MSGTSLGPADIWNLRALARGGGVMPNAGVQRTLPEARAGALPSNPLGVPGPQATLRLDAETLEQLAEQERLDEAAERAVVPDKLLREQAADSQTKEVLFDEFLSRVQTGYLNDAWFGVPSNTDKLAYEGGFYFREHALALPNYLDVREAAFYQMHDAPWAGHVGRERTKFALKQAYWWQGMDADIKAYVETCDKCQRNKARHQIKENRMSTLPAPDRPWDVVGIDFITNLPVTKNGYDAIAVISCHSVKMMHLVPCLGTVSGKEFAGTFRRQVFRLHGLPRFIVSDRGVQFTSGLWTQLCADLGIKLRMSSAYQPSTDGQVERANKTLEEMIRSFVNSSHTDWDEYLDCAEFAINKAKAAATGCAPFDLVYYHAPMSPPDRMLFQGLPLLKSRMSPETDTGKNKSTKNLRSNRAGREYAIQWVLRYRQAKVALQAAKARMKDMTDHKRTDRILEVGDLALLSTKNLGLKRPHRARKFCPLFVGPFKVLKRIGRSAYELDLPADSKLHPVFHISKLWKYKTDVGRAQVEPDPIWLDQEELAEVQDVLNCRGTAGKRTYLVQWKGKDCMYATWEPEANLDMCREIIDNFHARRTERRLGASCFLVEALGKTALGARREPSACHIVGAGCGDCAALRCAT